MARPLFSVIPGEIMRIRTCWMTRSAARRDITPPFMENQGATGSTPLIGAPTISAAASGWPWGIHCTARDRQVESGT